uniref:hypothetical protein n=1 Tax=Acinetobacter indicus TaxID=756892 RepID=UPI001C08A50B
ATDKEIVEVNPLFSVLPSKRSKTPDRKQKAIMVAEQKPSPKKETPSVKLLKDAIKSGTVASRTRLKRKSPEVLSKSLTQPLGKKTKDSGTLVPELSDFVSQDEIDYMLNDEKRPEGDVSNRQIAVSRRVDFGWFSANDLDIAPMFEILGLRTFCESYGEAAIETIKEFYTNLIFYDGESGPKFLKTSVGGRLLIFSTRDVNALYGCENHPPPATIDKNQAYSMILGHKVAVKNYLQSTKLSLKLRVLHRAVLFCLLPRIGSVDTITTKDACVMAQLMKGIPINMGVLIFEHMAKSLSKSD